MNETLPPSALSEAARSLERACGIVFSNRHGQPLRSGLTAAAAALGMQPAAFLERIRAGDEPALRALVDWSVVGETYFFRHPEQLAAVRSALRGEPRDWPLRVWCAGCASGEEAYTMASILLDDGRAGAAFVLGTDVSARAIQAARRGRYGSWSLRGLAGLVRPPWLRPEGGEWTIAPEVSRLTVFRTHNLVADPPPSLGFDLVLCRNVLIYFDRAVADGVVRRLFDAVRPGGWVALAPAENLFAEPLGFERVDHRGGALWRKIARERRAAAPAPAPKRAVAQARPLPPPPASEAPPISAADGASAGPDPLETARRAASEQRWGDAEREASDVGERQVRPEPFLFAAAAAEARGDLSAAVRWLGRALFLDPGHVLARASLVPLLERVGDRAGAARARRQALAALASVPDDQLLPGVDPVAAGALRNALASGPWCRLEVNS